MHIYIVHMHTSRKKNMQDDFTMPEPPRYTECEACGAELLLGHEQSSGYCVLCKDLLQPTWEPTELDFDE